MLQGRRNQRSNGYKLGRIYGLGEKDGMSEEEFWNSDPVFFNECLEVFCELEKAKGGALIGEY